MLNIVESIITDASKRFARWVDTYKPWVGDNHTTERNLSLQFATAFLKQYENGLVFMEVPFKPEGKSSNSCHLDAYLSAPDFDLLLECKNIYAPSQVSGIQADIDRMNTDLVDQIHSRYGLDKAPGKTHGVVFAETWYPHVAEWWNGEDPKSTWEDAQKLPSNWSFKTIEVCTHVTEKKKHETLYWLYGVSDEPIR